MCLTCFEFSRICLRAISSSSRWRSTSNGFTIESEGFVRFSGINSSCWRIAHMRSNDVQKHQHKKWKESKETKKRFLEKKIRKICRKKRTEWNLNQKMCGNATKDACEWSNEITSLRVIFKVWCGVSVEREQITTESAMCIRARWNRSDSIKM